jgi:hypothetical protein
MSSEANSIDDGAGLGIIEPFGVIGRAVHIAVLALVSASR